MQNENKIFDDLMIDYLSGNISEMDKRRLSELLKSNVDFKMEFDKMIKLRAVSFVPQIDATKEANFKRLMEQLNENVPAFSMSRTWNSRLRQIAAIIIFVVSVSVSLFYIYRDITTPGESTICYETVAPIGSQTKIILPDSTIVWLNSGSFLKYSQSFGKKNREVALSGEGYFVVKKDKSKPFLVHTVKLDVKVMGTVFNVRAYNEDEDVEVNLIEGVVNVSFPENKKAGSLTMKPNEKLVFNKLSKHVESFQTDAYRSALWTSGKLCFVDATIEQISKDLERKYEVKIQIENKLIKKELFSGSLNLNLSLKEILSYIDVDKKFKISQVGDTIKIR
jgi:ferric-dicitrate binding protein FerR (iron transport regulator)